MSRRFSSSLAAASLALTLALALGGCLPGENALEAAAPAIPARYDNARANAGANFSTDWVALFGVGELTRLSQQVLAGNFDLDAAAARILEAEAQAQAAGSALYPQIGGTANAARNRSPGTLRSKEPPFNESIGNTFSFGVTASYALDFWGRNRALAQAGRLSAQATRYDYETLAITTLSVVCTTYFQIVLAQDRVRITRENIRTAQEVLKALRARVEVGTGSDLDIAQQETVINNLRATIPALEQQVLQNRNTLAVLAGRIPESRKVTGVALSNVRLPHARPGLPSALLLRRPDIASLEAQLKAADANIHAARAAFYPSITLNASASLASIALKNLLRPEALAANAAAGLTQPIFDGHNLEAQLDNTRARRQGLIANYRKTIVTALSDVENALIAVRKTGETEALRARAVATARRALELTRNRLNEGTIDVTVLLSTQQTLFSAQDALAQARGLRLQALVGLFQALGGGFERRPDEIETQPAMAAGEAAR